MEAGEVGLLMANSSGVTGSDRGLSSAMVTGSEWWVLIAMMKQSTRYRALGYCRWRGICWLWVKLRESRLKCVVEVALGTGEREELLI